MGQSKAGTFWSIGLSGLIGAAIGAGGTFFTQKQAHTAENHYYMELDKLRHATVVEESRSLEDKLGVLESLSQARQNGYRSVFDENIQGDIAELRAALARIEEARQVSEQQAEEARRIEDQRAAEAAQERKEQAVRTNPLILQDCGPGTQFYCP